MKARQLSLVIPAYNEELSIRQAIEEAAADLPHVAGDFEILVVDDGSRDETSRVVRACAIACPHVRLLRHAENRGYGAALRSGFEAARFDRIAFTDADCQFALRDLNLLLPLTDEADIAAGWRIDRKDIWRRRFFSWGYNTLARFLLGTGVRDVDCALKVFRRDSLQRILPEANDFFVNTEMLTRARLLSMKVVEVGVRHRPRSSGVSKVALHDIPRTLGHLLPFWWQVALGRTLSAPSIPAATAMRHAA